MSSNQKLNHTQSWPACTHFPALCDGCTTLLWTLIGSLDRLHNLLLAIVITLVLLYNCSITKLQRMWTTRWCSGTMVCGSNSLTLVAVHVLCFLWQDNLRNNISVTLLKYFRLNKRSSWHNKMRSQKSTFGRESKIAFLNDFSKTRRGNLKFIYHHLFFLLSEFLINYSLKNKVLAKGMKAVNGP